MKLNRIQQEKELEEVDDLEDNPKDLEGMDDLDEDYGDDLTDDYYEDSQPPMEKRADLLKSLTNFDQYQKDAFNNWLGMIWNEDQGKFVQNPNIKPIMSIKGATWCAGVMRTYTRDNNIITDISYDEYRNIMIDIINNIWLNLGTRDDIGIKEEGDLIRVANELEHSAALALMGAGEGKYKQFLGTTVSRHENINQQQPMGGGQGFGYPMQPTMIPQKTGAIGKIKRMILGR